MFPLFLAAVAVDATPRTSVTIYPDRQARAVVRIVRPAKLRFDAAPEESIIRATQVRDRDGSVSSARLIEFY